MNKLTVFYRMCSTPSTNPSPVFQEDKLKLNMLCLRSFVNAFQEVKPKVVFICDYCDEVYKMLVGEICLFEKEFIFTQIGINATCLLQYKLAREVEGDVLFQECDYVYRFNTGKFLQEGIESLQLVSPYDHRNFYIDKSIHSDTCNIKLIGEQHWRSTERNTMTFGTTSNIVRRHYDIFTKYGYLDNEVWKDLAAQGYPLYVPIPSLATHMAKDWLAPSVQWEAIWKTLM